MAEPTIDPEIDRLYDNRRAVPEHADIIAGWERDAAAARPGLTAELDVAYGDKPRQRIDYFTAERDTAEAALLFIHGGYWRGLDKSLFSHLALGPLAHGVSVAMPSYTLCPEATLEQIIDEMRTAAVAARRRFGKPLVVAGHSAGGHLTACLTATDWAATQTMAGAAPADMIRAAYAISGLFDLSPLLQTAVNADLRLDEDSARAASPTHWTPPPGVVVDVVVGGAETDGFIGQSRDFAEAWGQAGATTRYEATPGDDHFTVVAPMADADSAMTRRIVDLCGAAPR